MDRRESINLGRVFSWATATPRGIVTLGTRCRARHLTGAQPVCCIFIRRFCTFVVSRGWQSSCAMSKEGHLRLG